MSRNTTELAADLMHASLLALIDAGGSLPNRMVLQRVEEIAKPEGEECIIYKSGLPKWKAIIYFQSIGLVKADWIQKRKGTWHITPEGEKATQLTPRKMWEKMQELYKAWKSKQLENNPTGKDGLVTIDGSATDEEKTQHDISTEEVESLAMQGIEKAIKVLTPYEFQDLVAALFRGMGYYTPFVAPKGKDGGVDVIAYKDPLGAEAPAILCQVKHRPEATAGIADVQRLMGALQIGKNVGLFVTSGRFSNDAIQAARTAHVHMELIDMPRFIELWIQHYENMNEEDRALLRLRTIHVLSE